MRRLTHLFVLAAFLFSSGGQWYALQCVAWVKMIHDYAQVVPLTEAVSMTFSGHYPCEICRAIAEKKADEDRAKVSSLQKYDTKFLSSVRIVVASPSASPLRYVILFEHLLTRSEPPPTPPPRQALG